MAQISINPEQIDSIVMKLNEASNDVENIWRKVINEIVPNIEASWVGEDSTHLQKQKKTC